LACLLGRGLRFGYGFGLGFVQSSEIRVLCSPVLGLKITGAFVCPLFGVFSVCGDDPGSGSGLGLGFETTSESRVPLPFSHKRGIAK